MTNTSLTFLPVMRAIEAVLKSVGQIFLQENAVSGFLILCGIFYGSFYMGFAALAATGTALATAKVLKFEKSMIQKGMFGFNAALVGVAGVLVINPGWFLWISVISGAIITALLQVFFMNRKWPVFTLPFVLVTWVILILGNGVYPRFLRDTQSISISVIDFYTIGFKGYGQVVFQGELISGILFFVAVLIASPVAAVYGFIAAGVSAVVAVYLKQPVHDVGIGLLSFNAVLCAIVFAGKNWTSAVWVITSVVLSLLISMFMLSNHLPQLTFPFVASCFILVLIRNARRSKKEPTELLL